MEALGTALSYLVRVASCWRGCMQDTHNEERLVGRLASNAGAALQLLKAGYYVEAVDSGLSAIPPPIGKEVPCANVLRLSIHAGERRKSLWVSKSPVRPP